jgi:DNA-binding MarR family transcriptional regulator
MIDNRASVIHDPEVPLERRVISLILCLATEKKCEIERATAGLLQSYVQVKLLHALANAPAGRLTVGELSRRIEEPVPGVSRSLGKLVEAGFVAKARSAEDQRTVHVSITEAGRRAQREADDRLLGVTTGLAKGELAQCFELLLKVYANTEMRPAVYGREKRAS